MSVFEGSALTVRFIANVGLTASELLYGFRNSWVDERDVIGVALAQYRAGMLVDDVIERLALLLDDERDVVGDIASERSAAPEDDLSRVWIFLFAKWVFENDDTPSSFERIEELYSEFDYPAALEGFVGYMPADPGEQVGYLVMERNWRDFIENEAKYFRARLRPSHDAQ